MARSAPASTDERADQRWRSRPVAARAVQLLVLAIPIAASVGCAAAVSAALPHARHLGPALGWWAVVLACSTLTMYGVDRVARRLLPLALLLRLSLLFPDQAPKRFRVAARSWSTRRVREQIAGSASTGATTAPVDAATHIIGLLASLAAHDRRTRGHCERVRAYNDLLAEELGLSDADRDRLRWAALIHDIGKLKVSRRLLNKPGEPTPREWQELRAHPERGAEIAAPLMDWLGPWGLAIAQHHEHWDGSGYPHGLAGTDIALGARIVGVADAFEVMTSPRPYSKPMSAAAAREELASCAGTHFDPQVVRALFNISLGRLRKAMGAIAWFSQVPLLASMPRLSAALIQGGQQAAAGAGGAIGVVAVSTVPAAATHAQAHDAVHHHPTPVAQSGNSPVDPLAAVLALTGRRVAPQPATVPTARAHAKSHAAAKSAQQRGHSARSNGHAATHANAGAHGHAAGHANAGANGNAVAHGHGAGHKDASGATTRGHKKATGKRHHGHTPANGTGPAVSTAVAPSSAAPVPGCTTGSGVRTRTATTASNSQARTNSTDVTIPPGMRRCD